MPPPVRGRRRRRRSPPELVFGFSPEGRRREEAFYLSLDGNAQIEELLERDRMAEEQELLEHDRLAEEQRITDLRRQRDKAAHRRSESRAERPQLGQLRGGQRPANSPGGCRARTRSRRRFLLPARQVGFPLRSRSFGGPRRHGKGQRARATRPIAPLASPRRGGGRRCRRLACTADGGRHRLVS